MSDETPDPQGYSEESFRRKLSRNARTAGEVVVERALQFHYALQKPDLPHWARVRIVGALGYFVLPLDAMPDILPGAGYVDDLGVLAIAFGTVASHIDDGVRAKAQAQLRRWFGPKPTGSVANENAPSS